MIDRRRFLSTTVSSVAMLSVRRAVALAAGKQKAMTRTLMVEGRYLNWPVRNGGVKRHVKMVVDGKILREFDISLAERGANWWAFTDIAALKGKVITIQVDDLPGNAQALSAIKQSDQIVGQGTVYREALRPQFHFSTRRGFQSDADGLVFYGGEYHLFYQHDPYGVEPGAGHAPHWGHAVSKDLVHWTELPDAIYPEEKDRRGILSGSTVVDRDNTAGFQTGAEKPLIAIFTYARSTGEGQYDSVQGIAFSNDRGRTWTKYRNNPVLPSVAENNRDPKVIWYAPEKKWVMALFLDRTDYSKDSDPAKALRRLENKSSFGLFSSRDLKTWEKLSEIKIPGEAECPELFEIAVDGNPKNTRWITYGASGRYLIGMFDGKTFTRESGPHVLHHGNCFYASQTFNNIPAADGRRILIPWGVNYVEETATTPLYKGMPFNQMMGIPVELTLRTTADAGLQLFVVPVKELQALRTTTRTIKLQPIKVGENPLATLQGELIDLTADISVGGATQIVFTLRGVPVSYDVKTRELSCSGKKALLKVEDGRIRLRMLVDRTSIDIFGNEGRLYMPMGVALDAANTSLQLRVEGGGAFINTLDVSELKSIWT